VRKNARIFVHSLSCKCTLSMMLRRVFIPRSFKCQHALVTGHPIEFDALIAISQLHLFRTLAAAKRNFLYWELIFSLSQPFGNFKICPKGLCLLTNLMSISTLTFRFFLLTFCLKFLVIINCRL